MSFIKWQDIATEYQGEYRLLARLTDTTDATFDDVIAEYRITYSTGAA